MGAEGSYHVVSFLDRSARYRRLGTTVGEFYDYGAGSDGVFLSVGKETRTISSVAMLSQAAMDKNLFFLSGVVFAIDSFRVKLLISVSRTELKYVLPWHCSATPN